MLGHEREFVGNVSLPARNSPRPDLSCDTHALDHLVVEDKLLAVRCTLEEFVAAGIDARSVDHRREHPVVGVRRVLELFVASAPKDQQARQRGSNAVVLERDLKRLHRKVDARENLAVPKDPPADVLVAGIPEQPIREEDADPAGAWFGPAPRSLEEDNLRRDARSIESPCIDEVALVGLCPDLTESVPTKNGVLDAEYAYRLIQTPSGLQ